jgi:CheY-like chemotaxis protein
MQSYNILLVDDEKDVCEVFIENAREISIDENFDLQITDCQNWQDGSELLQKQYFHAVILDAKCMIDREQKTENFGFLSIALERLREIERKQDRHIPFAVNTGQFGEREREMMSHLITERKGKIFDKKKPKEDLIKFLVSEIENESSTLIEKNYSDVFEIFKENLLDITFRNHLLKLLKVYTSDNPTDIKQSLSLLRSLQEQLFQTLNKKDKQIVPDTVISSFRAIHKHLSGNKDRYQNYQPTTMVWQNNWIENLSECLYEITSDNGSHHPYKNTPLPNKYTVQSLTFAFLEQLLWFKSLMK